MPQNRYYSSTAVATTLTGSVSNSATTINVASTTGFPVSFPYTLILDYGEASEEVVKVTNAASLTLTVVRAQDGTAAVSHSNGAGVQHGVSAQDFNEPQQHIAASSAVHGTTGSVVGTTDTQTLTNKTISLGSNTLTMTKAQLNTAVTDADVATLTGTETLTNKTLTSPTISSPTLTSATLDAASTIGGVSGTTLAAKETAWTSFTPTWTGVTVGNATQTARYKQIGKLVFVQGSLTLGTTTSITDNISHALPVAANASVVQPVGGAHYRNASGIYAGMTYADGGAGTVAFYTETSSFPELFQTANASRPFSWNPTNTLFFDYVYEAA